MELETRKPIRLENYDYSQNGAYFITVCVKDRKPILSNIVGATIGRPFEIQLTQCGEIVKNSIENIPKFYPDVMVDNFVIMPNHIHLLLRICVDNSGRPMTAPTISNVINQAKGYVTKRVGFTIWQKSYYDHVIRNQDDYNETWEYIENNPKKYVLKQTQDG